MSVGTRFSQPSESNAFDGMGIRSIGTALAYAATIALPNPSRKALRHYIDVADLTGATTINAADVSNLEEGDEIIFRFKNTSDARIITWGTNFRAAGTFTVGALGVVHVGVAKAIFMDSKIHILSTSTAAA
jgi:hypothetical protein